jgi:hypothetical protein
MIIAKYFVVYSIQTTNNANLCREYELNKIKAYIISDTVCVFETSSGNKTEENR